MANFSFVCHLAAFWVCTSTTPGNTFTVVWVERQPEEVVLGIFNFPQNIGGNHLLWMSVSSYSMIRTPRLWQGLCVHVDDLLLGGRGTAYRQTVNTLRSRCPFRKWKRNQGEFCGSLISQDVLTKEITVSQSTFALKINKVTFRARAQPEDKATTAEVRSLRECNGAVQWLAKESRPDLAVQVSVSQQVLSDLRVRRPTRWCAEPDSATI